MKRNVLILPAILLCLAVSGCADDTPENQVLTESIYDPISLEEAVADSTCAVVGAYQDVTYFDSYVYYCFAVEEVLYGAVDESALNVYALRDYVDMSGVYEAGELYILILTKADRTIYDTEDYYIPPCSQAMMPVNGPYLMYGEEVSSPDGQPFADYLCALWEQVGTAAQPAEASESISYETDAEEIAAEADFIGYVTIQSLDHEGEMNVDVFVATVTELYKGGDLNTCSDGTILLSLKKGAAEVGETYFIAFDQVDEYSVIYTQTTLTSVIAADELSAIDEITALLG